MGRTKCVTKLICLFFNAFHLAGTSARRFMQIFPQQHSRNQNHCLKIIRSSGNMLNNNVSELQESAPFHLAFPVRDVEEARTFYCSVLGCSEGRSSSTWVDFNLYGHQIVAHHVAGYNASSSANTVDGDAVPVPHFGVVLTSNGFHSLAERLKQNGVKFVIEPHLRFIGMPGEQWTMFFHDPSGNSLEFKAMTTPENLFAKYTVV